MSQVFTRQISILFEGPGGASVSPDGEVLNIGFTVERSLDLEPSSLNCTVFNLSTTTQEALKDATGWTVSLTAGYKDQDPHVIFKGDIRNVRHRREPPLLATDIEADDGGAASKVTVNRHFPKGTTVGKVFQYLQEQSTLGAGNQTRITQNILPTGLPDRLENGMTVSGYAMDELGDIAKSRGYTVSSQNNEVVVLQPGEALEGVPSVQIGANTGLIGYPYVDNEGLLVLNHRLLPNVAPGTPLDISAEFVDGTFVVERAVYSGSLWGDDFNIEVEGRQSQP